MYMKVLSNELGAFVMWIVDGTFACHIMNTNTRPPSRLHDADTVVDGRSAHWHNEYKYVPAKPTNRIQREE